jgi:uncharacterized RDD family membrane protein YckC
VNAPAGFWRRYAAYSIDALVVALLALPLLVPRALAGIAALEAGIGKLQLRIFELFDASMTSATGAPSDPFSLALLWADDPALNRGMLELVGMLTWLLLALAAIVFAIAALWFIGFESSRWQATPGKRLLGLKVTGLDGGRPPPWRIALRFVAGVPSWMFLHLGHAMAGWNREKRALHDFVAGTRVLLADGAPAGLPRWARAWLLLQVAGFFGFVGYVLLEYARMALEISSAL